MGSRECPIILLLMGGLTDSSTFVKNHKQLLKEQWYSCERFEPRSHFKSRLSLIVRVNVFPNMRTVVVDNLCGSHLQSHSELYHVS